MDVTIRPLRPEDSDAVLDLTARAFTPQAAIDARIEATLGGASWQQIKCGGVRRELETAAEGCAVAEHGGKLVGYITTAVNTAASRGTIVNVAVDPHCQGAGIGRRLIMWAIAYFRDLGLHHAKIETLETNVAGCHLYPAIGFKEVARQVHFALKL